MIPGLPLVYVVLLVNVVAVLAMPPALVFLFMLANDREVMGDLVSPRGRTCSLPASSCF